MPGHIFRTLQYELQAWADREAISRSDLFRIESMLRTAVSGQQQFRRSNQRPELYMSDLRAEAWWDPKEFEWTSLIEEYAKEIIHECKQTRLVHSLRLHPEDDLVVAGNWEILSLFTFGQKHDAHCDLLPRTVRLIEKIPTATQACFVYFSSLAPRTTISPHCGPTNCRLRCHVGLAIPPNCYIRVGGEERTWSAGKCIIFDDSFEHEVRNASEARRDVLIVDFWHPELTLVERSALQYITRWLTDKKIIKER